MKKIYLLAVAVFSLLSPVANAQCTIDPNNTNFFSPGPDSLPCIVRTVPYSEVIQIAVPATIDLQQLGAPISYILTIDSIVITGVSGLPTGISYDPNPANGVFYGGTNGCATVSGTTSDAVGNYPLDFIGTLTAHGTPVPPIPPFFPGFDGDTVIDFSDLQAMSTMFNMSVDVINPGDQCRPVSTGINNISAGLTAALQVYPNPNNGMVKINTRYLPAGNATLMVTDNLGRVVLNQAIETGVQQPLSLHLSHLTAGLYTVIVKTTEGTAAKNIAIH